MVTTLDHVGQKSMFWPKNSLSKSKTKRVWFSGAREPIQMKNHTDGKATLPVYKIGR